MDIAVLGIGKYSEVLIELCLETGNKVEGLYHFNSGRNGEKIMGYEIKGDYNDFLINRPCQNVIVSIGDNHLRSVWLEKLQESGFNTVTLIHPTAYIAISAKIGKGVYIHVHSFIWTSSIIEDSVIISPKSCVAHHVIIGKGSHLSANSTIGSYVNVGQKVTVGINAGIISKPISVGNESVIGANSMILNNVEEKSIMIGTPGKPLNK